MTDEVLLTLVTSDPIALNTWTTLELESDENYTFTIRINGVVKATGTCSGTPRGNTGPFRLGHPTTNRYVDGSVVNDGEGFLGYIKNFSFRNIAGWTPDPVVDPTPDSNQISRLIIEM
jgi:hypothetical protein